MNSIELTLLITFAGVVLAGWVMILHELYYGYSAKESDFMTLYEWKIPGCRYWVKAELLHDMVVFNMWDKGYDDIVEVCWCTGDEWFFLDLRDDIATTHAKRMCDIIRCRYADRVALLQQQIKLAELRIVK